ncbi:MAG: sugar phosphate isomerase/epimerase family protein [bacterium]
MTGPPIRIGNQTSVAATDPFAPFHYALKHGFDAFEWFSDRKGSRGFDFSLLSQDQRERLARCGHERDVDFSVHAATHASPFGAHADSLHAAVDFAGAVDAGVVVFHLEPGMDNPALVEALQPVISHADGAGVRLAIENTPAAPPPQFNDLFARLTERDQAPDRVGMCFDMGHANLFPATRNDYVGYFDQLNAAVPIVHLHAHENYGDRDSHLPIGQGPSARHRAGLHALLKRLRQRGFVGSIIMEQWPEPPSLLDEARNILRHELYHATPQKLDQATYTPASQRMAAMKPRSE